ncbi:hypothetical protein NM688_g2412 [Phlebia brevispora]|uniref:Uncharacterized protein n=1 Tax=Phlebia brevispora TaxID=194682 RepID=A0ACC1T8J8_9APHY|nr:hypothetical protein NM688_g2412 [Phlebia brevispora]
MQYALVFAVAASFFGLAAAQTPGCFAVCIETAVTQFPGTCEINDLVCQCNDDYFNHVMTNCLAADCANYDLGTLAWQQVCADDSSF